MKGSCSRNLFTVKDSPVDTREGAVHEHATLLKSDLLTPVREIHLLTPVREQLMSMTSFRGSLYVD